MSTSRLSRFVACALLALSGVVIAACAASTPTTACAPGLYAYKGGCLDAVSQNYATCTETRGQNLTTEDKQKIAANVDLGLKGGGGSVEIDKKVTETELPDVAIQVVKDCLEISKRVATPAQQVMIQQQIDSLQQMLSQSSKGSISLNPEHGPYKQPIAASGTDWPPNIEMEIAANSARVRTTTAGDGSFHATINLDPTFESVSPPTVTIRASPVKASTQFPADALYTIDK